MATFFGIVNASLAHLGEPPIESRDDQDPRGAAPDPTVFTQFEGFLDPDDVVQSTVHSIYPQVRDELLNAYPWSWLRTRARLDEAPLRPDEGGDGTVGGVSDAALAAVTRGDWPFPYRFHKPRPLIGNIREVHGGTPATNRTRGWEALGTYLYTEFRPVIAVYQGDVGEPAYPALFVTALSLRLAAALAWPLTQDNDAQRVFAQQAEMAVANAQRVDAQSALPQQFAGFAWAESHAFGETGWGADVGAGR